MSIIRTIFILLLYCLLFGYYLANEEECIQENECICRFNEFTKIDITPISNTNKTASSTFLTATNLEGLTYFFSGCKNACFIPKDYNINNLSKSCNVSLLLYNATSNGSIVYESNSNQIRYHIDKTNRYLLYKGIISTRINLICDNYEKSVLSIVGPRELSLFSPYTCTITEHPGLSTGTILLMVFFTVTFLYLFGGALALYFLRGARGLEMIPNIDFWMSLPGLVRDGIIFLFNGCNPSLITTAETYDRI